MRRNGWWKGGGGGVLFDGTTCLVALKGSQKKTKNHFGGRGCKKNKTRSGGLHESVAGFVCGSWIGFRGAQNGSRFPKDFNGCVGDWLIAQG